MTDPEAQAAVLVWLVNEHQKWRESGFDLGKSETVAAKTQAYWAENNPFTDFAAECLVFVSGARCGRTAMREGYKKWCDMSGAYEINTREFNNWLRKQSGVREEHTKHGDFWWGVGVRELG